MQSFKNLLFFLLALLPLAFAQEAYGEASLSTSTTTRTVFYVVTETSTGVAPTSVVAEAVSSAAVATSAVYSTLVPLVTGNSTSSAYGTGAARTATGTGIVSHTPTASPIYEGAAAMTNVNYYVAALVAGAGLLML